MEYAVGNITLQQIVNFPPNDPLCGDNILLTNEGPFSWMSVTYLSPGVAAINIYTNDLLYEGLWSVSLKLCRAYDTSLCQSSLPFIVNITPSSSTAGEISNSCSMGPGQSIYLNSITYTVGSDPVTQAVTYPAADSCGDIIFVL